MNKRIKLNGFGKVLVAGVAAVAMAGAPMAASAYGWHGHPVFAHRGPVFVGRGGPGFGAVLGGALVVGATAGLVASALSPPPAVVYAQAPTTVVYENVPPPGMTTTVTTAPPGTYIGQ